MDAANIGIVRSCILVLSLVHSSNVFLDELVKLIEVDVLYIDNQIAL